MKDAHSLVMYSVIVILAEFSSNDVVFSQSI